MHQGRLALATGFDVEVGSLHVGAKGLVLNHTHSASPIKNHQEGACGMGIAPTTTCHATQSSCSGAADMALLYCISHTIYRDGGGVVALTSFLDPPRCFGKALSRIDRVRLASPLLVVAFLETCFFFVALFVAVIAGYFGLIAPLFP